MPDTTAGASLLLKLYELRTEPTLRKARAWFAFEFHPQSAKDVLQAWLGPGHESAPYRMVTTYWDMACSLVVQGAIAPDMFNAANTEHFAFYSKIGPYLPDVRALAQYPDYLVHIEQVVKAAGDSDARVATFARYMERQREFAAKGLQRSSLNS